MFVKNYVNNYRMFKKFVEQMKEIKKYNYIEKENKRYEFNYESTPYTFVNFCEISLNVFEKDEEDDWVEVDVIYVGVFAIQNYNLQNAIKKAKEIINNNIEVIALRKKV